MFSDISVPKDLQDMQLYILDQGFIARQDFWEGTILVHTLYNKIKQTHASGQGIFNIFINNVLLKSTLNLIWHKIINWNFSNSGVAARLNKNTVCDGMIIFRRVCTHQFY